MQKKTAQFDKISEENVLNTYILLQQCTKLLNFVKPVKNAIFDCKKIKKIVNLLKLVKKKQKGYILLQKSTKLLKLMKKIH